MTDHHDLAARIERADGPSESDVLVALERIDRPVTGRELSQALEYAGWSAREAQRALQRCLDRGVIILGSGLRITAAQAQP